MGLQLEGIGLALSSRDGYSVVEEVIPGGAADRHKGVKPKDKIIAVGQEGQDPVNIIDMKLRDVVRLIRGKKGTPVQLTILRQSGEGTERFNVTIVRDKIDLEQQAAKLRFETKEVDGRKLKLAILELPSFYGDRDSSKRQSERDVEKLLKQVTAEKADGLLLDLSRNGGGLLESAVSISGFFIKDGGIVAVQQGKKEREGARGSRRRDPLLRSRRGVDFAHHGIGLGNPRRRAQGLSAGGDRGRRPDLRQGDRAKRGAAAHGSWGTQDHNRALLPAGGRVDATRGGPLGCVDPLDSRTRRSLAKAANPTRCLARAFHLSLIARS